MRRYVVEYVLALLLCSWNNGILSLNYCITVGLCSRVVRGIMKNIGRYEDHCRSSYRPWLCLDYLPRNRDPLNYLCPTGITYG